MIERVHLVYPHGAAISCPDAIGRHLADRLRDQFEISLHDWQSTETIPPSPQAVLLGHAHPRRGTCFRRSATQAGWGRVVLMEPFTTNPRQVGFLDEVLPACDEFLAITGPWWEAQMQTSPMTAWRPKLSRLDLAVDRTEFPTVRTGSSQPGQRRLVYVGGDSRHKNLPYLDAIAGQLPAGSIAWIGDGRRPLRHVERLGRLDFSEPLARDEIRQFDFMISVGDSDANPATILEAMSWGLIPMATATSGYGGAHGERGVIELPAADPRQSAHVIRTWVSAPSRQLDELRTHNWERIDEHYNWDRFATEVLASVTAVGRAAPRRPLRRDTLELRLGSLIHQGEDATGRLRARARVWGSRLAAARRQGAQSG